MAPGFLGAARVLLLLAVLTGMAHAAQPGPTTRQPLLTGKPVAGAPAEFNELMALSGREREESVNADAARWEPLLRAGIASARAAGRDEVLAEALVAHGRALWRLQDPANAERAFRESIASFRQLGRADLAVDPMLALGIILFAQYRLDEALALNREILAMAGENPRRRANALTNIGVIERRMGNTDAALAAFEQALALRRTLTDDLPELLPSSLQQLANVHADRGEHLRALELMQEAYERRLQIGGEAVSQAELSLARLYRNAGNPALALPYWRKGMASMPAGTDPRVRANAQCEYAEALHAAGDREGARVALGLARELAGSVPEAQSECTLAEAEAALREGRHADALALAGSERGALAGRRDVQKWLRASAIEAEALLALARPAEALALLDPGIESATRAYRAGERTRLLRLRAEALHQLGRDTEAYRTRLDFEAAERGTRGAGLMAQMATFLSERAQEREAARAEAELQARSIAALASMVALLLWLRWRDLRRRQRALAAEHGALSEAHAELARHSEVLEVHAHTDALTGALNRRAIIERLRDALAGGCSAILFDLDHFKRINDEHGHAGGDAALRHAADALRVALGTDAWLGRYGGEEFLAVLPGADIGQALARGTQALATLSASPVALASGTLTLTSSAGAAASQGAESVEGLLARADTALYQAKAAGRARILAAGEPEPSQCPA